MASIGSAISKMLGRGVGRSRSSAQPGEIFAIPSTVSAELQQRAANPAIADDIRQQALMNATEHRKAIWIAFAIGSLCSIILIFLMDTFAAPNDDVMYALTVVACLMVSTFIAFIAAWPHYQAAKWGWKGLQGTVDNLLNPVEQILSDLGLPPEDADLNKDGTVGGKPVAGYTPGFSVSSFRDNTGTGEPVPQHVQVPNSQGREDVILSRLHLKLGAPFPLDNAKHGKLTLGQVLNFWDQSIAADTFSRDGYWVIPSGVHKYIGTDGAKDIRVTGPLWRGITNGLVSAGLLHVVKGGGRVPTKRDRNAVAIKLMQYAYIEREETVIAL